MRGLRRRPRALAVGGSRPAAGRRAGTSVASSRRTPPRGPSGACHSAPRVPVRCCPTRRVASQAHDVRHPDDHRKDWHVAFPVRATIEVSAHCELPCGVYDPAQARIEAESIAAIIKKVADNDDPDFHNRAILIKEQRSELVKHHLWVLWTDYFKPPHFEKYPELHTLVNQATKLAGATGTKGEMDADVAQQLLDKIDEIDRIFKETKQG